MAATPTSSKSDEPGSQTRIQSVTRAVQLLVAIAESDDGMTAKDLAGHVGLSLPTTYHLLTTLWAEGMLMKGDRRFFRLGLESAIIAESFRRLEQPASLSSSAVRGRGTDG